MNDEGFINLKAAIEKSNLQDKILIWGATKKSECILSTFEKWGFGVIAYIDNDYLNIGEFHGYTVYGTEKLKEDKYYVYVTMQSHYTDVIDTLTLFGYKEYENFWYPGKLISLDGTKNYQDLYGNQLVTDNTNPINVRLRNGGKIEINEKKITSLTKITSEGDSYVKIGMNVSMGKEIVISSTNGRIEIEDNCKFDSYVKLRASSGGAIYIHEYCSVQMYDCFVASFNAKIVLGKDCMISYFVNIRAGNSHNIIDLNSLEHFDDNSDRDIVLGEHVWIGMCVTLLNGVTIGSGSTVGANSFVCKRSFKENCCIAGNPAKVIREKTAWIRDGKYMYGKYMYGNIEDYQDFIFVDKD